MVFGGMNHQHFIVHVSACVTPLDTFVLFSLPGPSNNIVHSNKHRLTIIHLKPPSPEGLKKNLDEKLELFTFIASYSNRDL